MTKDAASDLPKDGVAEANAPAMENSIGEQATDKQSTNKGIENQVVEPAEAPEHDGAEAAQLTETEMIEQLRVDLAATQAKADDYLDKLQRTAAEFQNSRRRQEKQLADEIERANGNLLRRLLPVLDDLDLAFQNVPSELAAQAGARVDPSQSEQSQVAWVEGFWQIRKKLMEILTEQSVSVIDTTGVFDPVRHEAISSEASDTVESGHIIDTLRTGYEYKGRVLRPALVRVAA